MYGALRGLLIEGRLGLPPNNKPLRRPEEKITEKGFVCGGSPEVGRCVGINRGLLLRRRPRHRFPKNLVKDSFEHSLSKPLTNVGIGSPGGAGSWGGGTSEVKNLTKANENQQHIKENPFRKSMKPMDINTNNTNQRKSLNILLPVDGLN